MTKKKFLEKSMHGYTKYRPKDCNGMLTDHYRAYMKECTVLTNATQCRLSRRQGRRNSETFKRVYGFGIMSDKRAAMT